MLSDLSQPLTIIVCTKFSVDVNALRADPATKAPDLVRAPLRISDFDENAIEEAVQLKERYGGRALAVSLVSHPIPRELLLKALAMGLDELHLVYHEDPTADSLLTANALAATLCKIPDWDLILCGEGSVDEYNSQTGPRLAEALRVPCIPFVRRIAIAGRTLQADRVLEDRIETLECDMPAVVTVSGESNTPRLPSLLQIMGAGRKPVTEQRLSELEVVPTNRSDGAVRWLETYAPSTSRKGIVVTGETPAETAERLLQHIAEEGVWRR